MLNVHWTNNYWWEKYLSNQLIIKYKTKNVISLIIQTLTSYTELWRDKPCSSAHVHIFDNLTWLTD